MKTGKQEQQNKPVILIDEQEEKRINSRLLNARILQTNMQTDIRRIKKEKEIEQQVMRSRMERQGKRIHRIFHRLGRSLAHKRTMG
jgi:hypothetical protein